MAIRGELCPGEDRETLESALHEAPAWILSGRVPLLEHHDDVRAGVLATAPSDDHVRRREAIVRGTAKRFVFLLETAAGMRIVKLHEVNTLGNKVQGLWTSIPRREHRDHSRASTLGVAAAMSCGYLELRRGCVLLRAIQIQTPAPHKPFLHEYLGMADRWPAFGTAMARMHNVGFFHADIKPYHGLVWERSTEQGGFDVRWIDFGRASFRLSRRKRIINLYQILRYCLPASADVQRAFMEAYCAGMSGHRENPTELLARVRGFLRHKLRSYPLDDAAKWRSEPRALGLVDG